MLGRSLAPVSPGRFISAEKIDFGRQAGPPRCPPLEVQLICSESGCAVDRSDLGSVMEGRADIPVAIERSAQLLKTPRHRTGRRYTGNEADSACLRRAWLMLPAGV